MPTQLFADTFATISNNEALPTYNASYTNLVQGWEGGGANQARPDNSGNCVTYYTGVTYDDDQYAQCTCSDTTNNSFLGIAVRCASGPAYYGLTADSGNGSYFVRDGTTLASNTTVGGRITDGDTLRMGCTGTTFELDKNGAEVIADQTDATYSSGDAGLYGQTSGPQAEISDWQSGNQGTATFQAAWAQGSNVLVN